jgi:hypothetical protein
VLWLNAELRWTLPAECNAEAGNRRLDVSLNERRAESKHVISAASQRCISPRILPRPFDVIPAINLDDEPLTLRQKISDE